MNYHLHFSPIVNKPNRALSNEEILELAMYQKSEICYPEERYNETHSTIDRCINYRYETRQISRKQITWKPSNSQNANKQSGSSKENQSQDQKNDKIHQFLVFALLLPNHPYSSYLDYMITILAPLYPQITFVKGNAVEFADLGNRYNIASYPHLLFFRNGINADEFYDNFLERYQQDVSRISTNYGLSGSSKSSFFASLRYFMKSLLPINMKKMLSVVPIITSSPAKSPNLPLPFLGTQDDMKSWKQRYVFFEYNEEVLAIYFSIWTKSLPRCIPQKFTAIPIYPSYEYISYAMIDTVYQKTLVRVMKYQAVWELYWTEWTNYMTKKFENWKEYFQAKKSDANTASPKTAEEVPVVPPIGSAPSTAEKKKEASKAANIEGSVTIPLFQEYYQQAEQLLYMIQDLLAVGVYHCLLLAYPAFPWLQQIPYPAPNVEPFITMTQSYATWDRCLYILSGIYTLIRLYQWCYVNMKSFFRFFQEVHAPNPHLLFMQQMAVQPAPPPPPQQ